MVFYRGASNGERPLPHVRAYDELLMAGAALLSED